MITAALWGVLAGSSLPIGALIAIVLRPPLRAVGLIMGFGAGALLSAVAYDLVGRSIVEGDSGGVAIGLLLGALVSVAGDSYVTSRATRGRVAAPVMRSGSEEQSEEKGAQIALGTVLDGIPKSFVMGVALVEGGGTAFALIAAVFIANVPEAISATSDLLSSRWAVSRIMIMWSAIMLGTGLACALGYAFFTWASGLNGIRVEAFAAGAIIAMLATTMMPEAYRTGGRLVGVVTACGFALGVGMTAA